MSFEREDIYNLDFKKLDLPDAKISKTKKAQILSHLLLYRNITLSRFAEKNDVDISAIKRYIQALIQALVIRGYYRKDRFIITVVLKHPKIVTSGLNPIRKKLLGLLAYLPQMKLKWIKKILEIDKENIAKELFFLVKRGLYIGLLKDNLVQPSWIWTPKDKPTISEEDTFIIGTCMMLRNAKIRKVEKLTNLSKEHIISRITYLMLYKKVEAKFSVERKIIGRNKLLVNIEKYHIAPRKIPLSSLKGSEKEIVGLSLLKKKTTVQELADSILKEESFVIKTLANLTARGTFQYVFDKTNKIEPIMIPELKPKRTIEEMATLSFFNYEALFGILSTQEKIPLRKLTDLMNRTTGEILEGIITLLFEGFITCSLKGGVLYIESIRRYSRTQEGTLERWEKIVLGMVIAKTTINVKDIAQALGVDKFYAQEKLYAFFGKGLIKGNIVGRNKLIPDEIPVFPPLVQLEDLPIHYQEIYGYLIANKKTSLKSIQKTWSKSAIATKNILFELTGSGLMHIELKGRRIFLLSHQKFLPNRDLEELGERYVKIVNEIEKSRRKRKIKLKKLSSKLNINEFDIFRVICQLIAHGYYKGNLSTSVFEKIGKLVLASKKTYCLNCGHSIKSPNDPCTNCEQLPQKCSICQGLIKRGENILECPNCSNIAHDEHMKQWLKIKEECPICKIKVTKRSLKGYVV